MIYLDNASTSHPKSSGVLAGISHYMNHIGASPGRGGYSMAQTGELMIQETRLELAKILGTRLNRHICFSSNATHSLNILLKGYLKESDHVVISSFEHNSVLRPLEALKKTKGLAYDIWRCNSEGEFDLLELKKLIRSNTRLIVCNHASNVIGLIIPIEAVCEVAREKNVKVLLDVSQTAGLTPIELDQWGVDFAAGTGHKSLMGPSGVGFLFARDFDDVEPLLEGGSGGNSISPYHPRFGAEKFEAGTQNYLGIAGLLGSLKTESFNALALRQKLKTKNQLIEKLYAITKDDSYIQWYGNHKSAFKVPLASFNLRGLLPNQLAYLLDRDYDIMVRAGLQCAPFIHKAIGSFPNGTVRISLGSSTTEVDIERLVDALKEIKAQFVPGNSERQKSSGA